MHSGSLPSFFMEKGSAEAAVPRKLALVALNRPVVERPKSRSSQRQMNHTATM